MSLTPRKLSFRALAAAGAIGLALATSSGAQLRDAEPAIATDRQGFEPAQPANWMFNMRYCEIVLLRAEDEVMEAWGTQGLNSCPQEKWEVLDPGQLASDFGVKQVLLNGPRFSLMDRSSNDGAIATGDPVLFGELPMRWLATIALPRRGGREQGAYRASRVARDNVWHFSAGRRVYELEDPEGQRHIMQSFSRIVDPELSLDGLPALGERLQLPPGWSFHTRVLTHNLAVPAVDGTAEVLQDSLANSYQRIP